ncbi:MAG: hypothetical protein P8Y58_10225, partial [Novosphingobium sp.]
MNTIKISIERPEKSASMAIGKVMAGIALVVALLGFPLVASDYQTFQLTGVMTYAVAALGLNLITGYVGQVSLGHNAFFALGSYTAVLANLYLGT